MSRFELIKKETFPEYNTYHLKKISSDNTTFKSVINSAIREYIKHGYLKCYPSVSNKTLVKDTRNKLYGYLVGRVYYSLFNNKKNVINFTEEDNKLTIKLTNKGIQPNSLSLAELSSDKIDITTLANEIIQSCIDKEVREIVDELVNGNWLMSTPTDKSTVFIPIFDLLEGKGSSLANLENAIYGQNRPLPDDVVINFKDKSEFILEVTYSKQSVLSKVIENKEVRNTTKLAVSGAINYIFNKLYGK